MDGLLVGEGLLVPQPDQKSEALDSDLYFTESGYGVWSTTSGEDDDYYYDGDALHSYNTLDDEEESCLKTIVDSDSSETIKFHWKVSSEEDGDYLEFYIDDTLQHQISGEVDWQQKSYAVSSGIHTLKWRYVKDSSGEDGGDCGWVDFVQWSGPSPEQDPANWETINYKHDLYGRRSEKKVDGFSTRYLYDGPQVIAEYDGNNNLLRKYIYGPGIDQPVCMIEEAESETYYYHYDGLGSVVALSDSSGDTVQTYEYSVYGQVAVEDANHPNPYMFAGRRFDIEIGLYYNRARYYNPYTGRLLQADPAGDGMNLYAYCGNSPIGRTDPSGLEWVLSDDEASSGWIDDALSGVPASLVNMVFQLAWGYRSYGNVFGNGNWVPDADDLQERFEGKLQTYVKETFGWERWGGWRQDWFNNNTGGYTDKVMEKAADILNAYLDEVDENGYLPRYTTDPMEAGGGSLWDLIELGVSERGPVTGLLQSILYGENKHAITLKGFRHEGEYAECHCDHLYLKGQESTCDGGTHYVWVNQMYEPYIQYVDYEISSQDNTSVARTRSSANWMWADPWLIPLEPESGPPAVISPRYGGVPWWYGGVP